MANDDLLKILIGLTAAVAGWVLAQFTSAAKTWFQRRKIKRLLLEELGDLKVEIKRLLTFYGRQLQIYGGKGIGNSSAIGLSNFIFRNYYKDALLSLNQDQRISYQIIHALVDSINTGMSEFRGMTQDIQNEHFENGMSEKIPRAGEGWGQKASAEYQACASLLWQVEYHLQNPMHPVLLPNTKPHQRWLQYLKDAEAEVGRLIEGGKNLDRSQLA